MKILIRTGVLLIGSFILSACMSLGKSNVNSLSEINSDEIIIVGKIVITPKIRKEEQNFPSNMLGTGRWMSKMFIAIDDKLIDMEDLGFGSGDHFGEAELGKTFYIKSKKAKALYFSGGMVMLGDGSRTIIQKHFPGGLKYSVGPKDKAIYIGTIKYHRDEFNALTKVELKDEYKKASKDFRKKFGKKYKLGKVKIKTIKS